VQQNSLHTSALLTNLHITFLFSQNCHLVTHRHYYPHTKMLTRVRPRTDRPTRAVVIVAI
jgi:hypothetical protein